MRKDIILYGNKVEIPASELLEHDGIMEQVTYEVSEYGMPLDQIPWEWVKRDCRINGIEGYDQWVERDRKRLGHGL